MIDDMNNILKTLIRHPGDDMKRYERIKMTKYEKLYGHTVEYFPNEEANVRKKLRLAREQLAKTNNLAYTYENQCYIHELNKAVEWCTKILEDIEDGT